MKVKVSICQGHMKVNVSDIYFLSILNVIYVL